MQTLLSVEVRISENSVWFWFIYPNPSQSLTSNNICKYPTYLSGQNILEDRICICFYVVIEAQGSQQSVLPSQTGMWSTIRNI